jgi:hypothetical protein
LGFYLGRGVLGKFFLIPPNQGWSCRRDFGGFWQHVSAQESIENALSRRPVPKPPVFFTFGRSQFQSHANFGRTKRAATMCTRRAMGSLGAEFFLVSLSSAVEI